LSQVPARHFIRGFSSGGDPHPDKMKHNYRKLQQWCSYSFMVHYTDMNKWSSPLVRFSFKSKRSVSSTRDGFTNQDSICGWDYNSEMICDWVACLVHV
jgi:hypothetical protein